MGALQAHVDRHVTLCYPTGMNIDTNLPITCHEGESRTEIFGPTHWRVENGLHPDGGQGRAMPNCSYCGSMHPQALLELLKSGAVSLESADWKYGWPHKFYVSGIANPIAGREIKCGSMSENGKTTPIMGKASATLTEKFYSVHLQDMSASDLEEIGALIFEKTRIQFSRDEKGLKYFRPARAAATPPPPENKS